MKRMVPHPLLTLGLAAMWLVLNDSLDIAHIVLGLLMGVASGAVYERLEPSQPGLRRGFVLPALKLAFVVAVDIVSSNMAVLRIVLGLRRRPRVAGFLAIPLELRDARGLAMLAGIVTATPGTAWAHHEAATNVLTLHVLDLSGEEQAVREFKQRYERPLLEMFE
ncbi:Na+/H+ antiporter subunit E [Caenimonas sp. SL110]|uniref:Na+/H+ antiporter subunit E n=1 Tax=Caenimonas sp. SL110 TaxID=1450524 RepID=UPI000652F0BF|nr:Na+/H+ antiporter subunit E [Caenimonas sp. SL110]